MIKAARSSPRAAARIRQAARSRWRWSAARAATSSCAAASTCSYEEVGLFQNVKWSHAQAIAKTAIKEFLGPDIGSVYLVYNEFRSVISQRVVIERLLPIPRLNEAEAAGRTAAARRLTLQAADPSASPRRLPVRARPGAAAQHAAAVFTSRCRSSARCWNRRPPSTPRA